MKSTKDFNQNWKNKIVCYH